MPVCRHCGRSVEFENLTVGLCPLCLGDYQASDGGLQDRSSKPSPAASQVTLEHIILSTEAAPDLGVAERLDIVTAEFAVGMGLLTDVFSAWRDVFGGRAKAYQNTLKDARKTVLQELRREAHDLGADAVLGVSLDYSEISGGGKSMLFLVASGTAVRLAKTH